MTTIRRSPFLVHDQIDVHLILPKALVHFSRFWRVYIYRKASQALNSASFYFKKRQSFPLSHSTAELSREGYSRGLNAIAPDCMEWKNKDSSLIGAVTLSFKSGHLIL
ncbi:MAG: hypothetical protein V7K41_01900 [Nostoc sp.]|uniref:hypothetical protein n=1 Tax=Nostoc sp. TaxID=1180 RepID=UPI002FF9A565